MGFFDSVKKFFDKGGIGLKLDLPKKFNWSDGVIPVTVTLTGHKTEPKRVWDLEFTVKDDEKQDSNSSSSQSSGSSVQFSWTHDGPFELAAGQSQQFDLQIPLPKPETKEEREQRAFGREASGFMEKAFLAVAGGASPESIHRYLVRVEAHAEGAHKPTRASRHIRQGRGTTISVGGVSTKF